MALSDKQPSVLEQLADAGITLQHIAKIEAITGVRILRVTEDPPRPQDRPQPSYVTAKEAGPFHLLA